MSSYLLQKSTVLYNVALETNRFSVEDDLQRIYEQILSHCRVELYKVPGMDPNDNENSDYEVGN